MRPAIDHAPYGIESGVWRTEPGTASQRAYCHAVAPCYDLPASVQTKGFEVSALPELSLLFVATFRDWVIIFMGIAVAAFFLVALILTIVLGLLTRALLKKSSALLDDSVKPLLGSANETANHVRCTTSFVSEAAVAPIIRAYGVVAGVRRAAGVIAGLTGASTGKRKQ